MGEFELLARIRERLPATPGHVLIGSGDDAAVVAVDGTTATSVDAVVDGVHFRRDQATFTQIGHKALATALSDLAAMGATPGEAYVVLGVPADLDEDDCLELLDGMLALAEATGTVLAGGDLTRASELFLAITVVGHAPSPDSLVGRAGAQPGDALVLTGEIGGAAAGLALLEDSRLERHVSDVDALRARQLEPSPRLGGGRGFAGAQARAMIDISDGLAGDAVHLAERSGVGLLVDGGAVPLATGAVEVLGAAGDKGLRRCLEGGEDYELLAAIPPTHVERAREAVAAAEGIALTVIGEVIAGEGVEIRLPGGELLKPTRGFDQLA